MQHLKEMTLRKKKITSTSPLVVWSCIHSGFRLKFLRIELFNVEFNERPEFSVGTHFDFDFFCFCSLTIHIAISFSITWIFIESGNPKLYSLTMNVLCINQIYKSVTTSNQNSREMVKLNQKYFSSINNIKWSVSLRVT